MTDRSTYHLLFRLRTFGSFFIGISMCGLTSLGQPSTTVAAPVFQETEEADDPELEIAKARVEADAAQRRFETTKKLSETGSASEKQLRVTELQRNLAILKLSSLLEPSRKQENLNIEAHLLLKYRNEELTILRRLYKRGSASELAYRRAVVERDVARANAEAIASENKTQRKLKAIEAAKSKYKLALREFGIAEKLFKTGSLSQPDFQRMANSLEIATAEWESAKESLGATAIVVEQ